MGSLNKEAAAAGEPVRVHCLSPGMVLTDLLLAGATDRNKQARTCPMHTLTLQALSGADSRRLLGSGLRS